MRSTLSGESGDGPIRLLADRPLGAFTLGSQLCSSTAWANALPLDQIVEKMDLDELTVAEAPHQFFDRLKTEDNLPDYIFPALSAFYGL